MYTLKYDKKIKEFRHRDSYLVRMKKGRSMAFKECKYYVIHDYYPLSGIGNDVDINIKTVRNFIYDFKDGHKAIIEYAANIIVESIKKEGVNLENTCLMIIPASKPEKTNKRFEYFCKINTWREDKFERSVANGTETVFVTLRFCVVRKQLKATLKPNAAGVQLPPHYYRNG